MIAKMSRVEVVCLSSIRQALVESLQNHALLHLEEVPLALEEAPDFLGRVSIEDANHDTYARLDDIERMLAEIAPLLSQTPSASTVIAAMASVADWDDETLSNKVEDWASGLRELTRRRVTLQDTIDVLNNYKAILEQVAPALGGGEVILGRGTRALVLTGDVKRVVNRLEERFEEEIGPGCSFHVKQVSRTRVVGLVSCVEGNDSDVSRILNQEGVTPVDMRDEAYENATISEVIERIDATMAKHRSGLLTLEGETNDLSGRVAVDLLAARAVVADRLGQFRAQARFAQSQMLTVIHGWTPSDAFDALQSAIQTEFPGEAEVRRISQAGIERVKIPTQLRNPGLFKPFEVLLKIFRPPTYGSIDPTAMIAVSFIVFYGFILGDVFYGLFVILFAKLLGRKWGHIEAVQSASTIGVYMGLSSIVFGVIYGEYFGNLGENLLGLPTPFHRAHRTTDLLIYAIMFGIVHVPFALILGIREDFRHHHTDHALEKLGMLLGLTAGIFAVCVYFQTEPLGIPLFTGVMASFFNYLALAMFVVGVVLIFKAMGMMGLIGVLEILSLGGNVLSYARLMALGVASIALADIANMLPGMMGYLIGIPAALVVHLLNIGIGIASPTIHSLRLNFVEFLPKFYSPEGKGFEPFKKETVA